MASGTSSNEILQLEEIGAMFGIFGTDWTVECALESSYSLNITNSLGDTLYFKVILPENYPLSSPPTYIISAPWMNRTSKAELSSLLEKTYSEHIGESILYLWITKIQDFIEPNKNETNEESFEDEILSNERQKDIQPLDDYFYESPIICHGGPVVDRKSVFQAHVAKVVSEDQVNEVLKRLKENKKIAAATHNMYAYRIRADDQSCISDDDDDGEHKAGETLSHLLQVIDAKNVLVVVSRWYGGVHLGSERYKHIKDTASKLLVELGYVTPENEKKRFLEEWGSDICLSP